MIPLLLAAALVDTITTPPADWNSIYVHEWGAVTFIEGEINFGTAPASDFHDEWEEPVVRAPVVYFYGAAFEGSFTVAVPDGYLTEIYPLPDRMDGGERDLTSMASSATWNIISVGADPGVPAIREDLLPDPGNISFEWALNLWRLTPSMVLRFEDGSREKFIYYECAIDSDREDYFYPVLLKENGPVLDRSFTGEMMTFIRTGNGIRRGIRSIEGVVEFGGSTDDIHEILCDWATGSMKSEEITAMLATWEDWIMGGSWEGDTLLVFPLADETIERMSSISLITKFDRDIEYSRFYVGILTI